ncbi:MAG: hypothetical protein ACR2O6_07350 [Ilumatobacteraceae bacterium]
MLAVRSAVAVAAALTVLAACSDDEPQSDTPALSIAEGETDVFLRADDVAFIAGFEGAEVETFEEFPLFENPDQRGPCGTEIAPASIEGASGRALTGSSISLVQIVVPTTAELEAYLTELEADSGPPCGPYRSTTNTGTTQTVSEVVVYGIGAEDTFGVAWTNLIEVDEGSVYAGVIALESEGTTVFVQVQSATPIPQEGIQFLSDATVLRLREARGDGE